MKKKSELITQAASNAAKTVAAWQPTGLASRALAALEKEGARIASELNERPNRSLQIVSTEGAFSALIKHGNKTFQFEGDSFAVTTHD